MSNFTTFFPSAGGGGGEGSGINSYAPFKVGTTDNNPQGYIHSTGVYTNPVDSSVWLKTGNQVTDTTNAYPNAYGVLDHRLTSGTDDLDVNLHPSMGFNGTDVYVAADVGAYTYRIRPIDEATRTWGNEISKDSSLISGTNNSYGSASIGYDSTAGGWLNSDYSASAAVINKWNAAFTSITSSFSIFAQTGTRQVLCIAVDTVNNNVLIYANNQNVYVYDLSNDTYTNTSYTLSTRISASHPSGMSVHPTTGKLWVVDASVVRELNASTGVATGTSFDLYPNAHLTSGVGGTVKGIFWKDADTLMAITQKALSQSYVLSDYDIDGINTVGDGTARTDSSGSAQPLFIKLK